jgi:hypothetical protein
MKITELCLWINGTNEKFIKKILLTLGIIYDTYLIVTELNLIQCVTPIISVYFPWFSLLWDSIAFLFLIIQVII